MHSFSYDVVIIGAGPAGMGAAISAREQGASVALVERNAEAGGILRQCIHTGFGLKVFKEELSGPEYAQRFINRLKDSGAVTLLSSMTLEIRRVNGASGYEVVVMNGQGLSVLCAKAVVLAMGCRERTRGEIKIPGARVAGVYTAGLAQRYINIENLRPGKRAVILGSGDIGLIMARRLSLEGMEVEGVYEIMPYANGLRRNIRNCLDDFGIPLRLSTTVSNILGKTRVEAVEVSRVDESLRPLPGTARIVPCDALLLAIGLIPENEVAAAAGVTLNPRTNGALVNDWLETSLPGVFACGNALHVHDLVDDVSAEAGRAGSNAARWALGGLTQKGPVRAVDCADPIGYTVPSTLVSGAKARINFRVRRPLDSARLEVLSKDEILLAGKPRSWKPALMEHIELPEALLSRAGTTISLRLSPAPPTSADAAE